MRSATLAAARSGLPRTMRLRNASVMPAASSSAEDRDRDAGIFEIGDIGDGLAARDKAVIE